MTLNNPDYFDFFDEPRKSTLKEKVLITTFTGMFYVIMGLLIVWLIF